LRRRVTAPEILVEGSRYGELEPPAHAPDAVAPIAMRQHAMDVAATIVRRTPGPRTGRTRGVCIAVTVGTQRSIPMRHHQPGGAAQVAASPMTDKTHSLETLPDMINKAVILAAGRGTRVQPLTSDMPKPMIPVLGKPVMEYIVEHLARQGIGEIMINVSHFAPRIQQYFGDGRRFGVRIGYSFEGHLDGDELVATPLGSAGALRKINDFGGFIDETTIVLCGDAIVDLDVQRSAQRHRAQRAIASVITREVDAQAVSNYGIVVSAADGRVVSFQEKPAPAEALSRMASTGIYLVEPAALDLIPADRSYDIGGELFPDLVRRGLPFYNQCCEFEWIDIGRVGDYWRIIQRLMANDTPGIPMPGVEVRPGVRTGLNVRVDWNTVRIDGPVYIGSGAAIEPGCTLHGPVWIGDGSLIEAGANLARSIVFDYAQVGPNANVREMIVSGNYCVTRDGHPLPETDASPDGGWWSDARSLLPVPRRQDAGASSMRSKR
jgi:mannose-1-phosphate guanylyltransferase